jgi:hypothetical protein
LDEILVERHQLNVNYVKLSGYATMGDLTLGLKSYFAIYDEESPLTVLAPQYPRRGRGVLRRRAQSVHSKTVRAYTARPTLRWYIVVCACSFAGDGAT